MRRKSTIESRFWTKVARADPDACWLWIGGQHRQGYGTLHDGKSSWSHSLAHRVSWELHCGAIPRGRLVLHRCDNPPCVNPAHLFLGSQSDNVRDMLGKGRDRATRARGERHGRAKLSEQQVRAARRLYFTNRATQYELAGKYHVSRAVIHRAIHGHTWSHIHQYGVP